MNYKKSCKAQSAIELLILVGAVMFFVTAFLLAVQISAADKEREKRTFAVKEIVLTVQDEINLALESSDGYSREFRIPEKVLNNVPYDINLVGDTLTSVEKNFVYLKTDDGKGRKTKQEIDPRTLKNLTEERKNRIDDNKN